MQAIGTVLRRRAESGMPVAGATPGEIVALVAERMERIRQREAERGRPLDITAGVEGRIRCSECRGRGVTADGAAWCSHCRLGWVDVASCAICDGAETVRNHDRSSGASYSVPCPACQGSEATIYARLRRAGVPEKYQPMTLAGWAAEVARRQPGGAREPYRAALPIARRIARMEPAADRPGLLLSGPPGRMKSGLAAGICHALAELGASIRWLSWGVYCDRLNELRDAGERVTDEVAADAAVDVLVIDDLGSDGIASDFRTRILTDIMERRGPTATRQRPTVVTTMLDFDELDARYGEHVLSRLLEACAPVILAGHDARIDAGA